MTYTKFGLLEEGEYTFVVCGITTLVKVSANGWTEEVVE